MDAQLATPIPRSPLSGVPSWIPDAQATRADASLTRRHASHIASRVTMAGSR